MGAQNIMRLFADAAFTVRAHTANVTLTEADFNQIHTTRGAGGAVVFTLPAASGNSGRWMFFINIADQIMTISPPAGEVVTHNDAAADDVGFEVAGELIGSCILAICDGTSWCCIPVAEETVTIQTDT